MPTTVHLWSGFKLMVMAGFEPTTRMISPNLSLGSNLRFGLLNNFKLLRIGIYSITSPLLYKPGDILITFPGSAASMASCIVLYGPFSGSNHHKLINKGI